MRRFKVKINDEVFEVEVEEVGRPEVRTARPVVQPPPAQPVQVAAPKAPAVAAPAPAQKPAAPAAPAAAPAAGGDDVRAPIPGVISAIKVSSGTQVKKGQVLLILEAMKMQNEILAPFDATVTGVLVSQGASVQTGDVLVTLAR
ncbi:MAG: acetyl-CoA carboxylase biotin carboxyl carrier protein subunit [Bacillota bacterium]